MSHWLPERLKIIWAITRKDLKIAFRFPKNFVGLRMIEPLRLFILLGLVYQSFFVMTNSHELGNWSRANYVPTLLLGAIFYSSFGYAYFRFRGSFLNEKYWKTIQIFLTAPVSKLDFLIASTLAMAVELSLPTLIYMALFWILYPIGFIPLVLMLGCLYLMLFGVLGVSLMQGAFAISNENYLFLFDYFYVGWALFSCFYYTESALPEFLRFLAQINPVYHAMEIARYFVFHHLSLGQILASVAYLFVFSTFTPLIGAAFFRKVVREVGINGF
ncbi:MAG: ABC transporter permease [Candidatus Omnitrophica bacterium]|nr:ABC transporter permease [Candidatus Omnitrophota bacterium]